MRDLLASPGYYYTLDILPESTDSKHKLYRSNGRQFMVKLRIGAAKTELNFLFGNQFEESWIVTDACQSEQLCPASTLKIDSSNAYKVTTNSRNKQIIKEQVSAADYGLMFYRFPFRTIGADLYAKEFQEHRRLLYDRQASGYVNVDELLR